MELYEFADKYRGVYHDAIPEVYDFYRSWEGYEDELAWAAVWLFGATQEESLLNAANAFYKRSGITNRKGLGSKIITIIDCR
jgi:endoglucanase